VCSSSCDTSFRRFPAYHSDVSRQIRPTHLLDCLKHNLYKAIVNLQRLRYFVGVTEELNFTRAAEQLPKAHSLLGYQITQLDDEPQDGERLTAHPWRARASMTRRAPLVPTADILFERENT
jgi:hypothetical protein